MAKHKNACISKTVLDREDYADFGCHNCIRLKAEHFLNTLALTFISFWGRFVFAVQRHYLFFCKRSSSYNLKKEKSESKKTDKTATPSKESLDIVSVVGVVDGQETLQSPGLSAPAEKK